MGNSMHTVSKELQKELDALITIQARTQNYIEIDLENTT
jgi:hypothetical protein